MYATWSWDLLSGLGEENTSQHKTYWWSLYPFASSTEKKGAGESGATSSTEKKEAGES